MNGRLSISSNVIVKAAGVDDFGQLRGQVRIVKLDRQFEFKRRLCMSQFALRMRLQPPSIVINFE
jgi:hypothetical protein